MTVAIAHFVPLHVFGITQGSVVTANSCYVASSGQMAVANIASGAIAGAVTSGGNLQATISGGISAAAFTWAGGVEKQFSTENFARHAAAGCVSAAAGGGKCGRGAVSALAGKAATWASGGNMIASIVAGGTASVIGGGKFENAAISAAFGYLYNCMQHPEGCGGREFTQGDIDESLTGGRYLANKYYANALYPRDYLHGVDVFSPVLVHNEKLMLDIAAVFNHRFWLAKAYMYLDSANTLNKIRIGDESLWQAVPVVIGNSTPLVKGIGITQYGDNLYTGFSQITTSKVIEQCVNKESSCR